jgi:hypothetical protein
MESKELKSSIARLHKKIRDINIESNSSPSNVVYGAGKNNKKKFNIEEYDDVNLYSAQAHDDNSISIAFSKHPNHIIFTNTVKEKKEDRKSFEKYGGCIYLYNPMTEKIASKILKMYNKGFITNTSINQDKKALNFFLKEIKCIPEILKVYT